VSLHVEVDLAVECRDSGRASSGVEYRLHVHPHNRHSTISQAQDSDRVSAGEAIEPITIARERMDCTNDPVLSAPDGVCLRYRVAGFAGAGRFRTSILAYIDA
jgi:hypothetical protein